MKTASLTYPTHRFIDTAPLVARFDILTKALLVLISPGHGREMLRCSQKVMRLIRVFNRLDRQNHLLARKLDMLIQPAWRDRVLRDLGGLRKLKLWEAARKRIMDRSAAKAAARVKPAAPLNPPKKDGENPAWLYTPERIAESERLKAWARDCAKASAHPLIFRDRFKVDMEGEFRLAPLPRGERAARKITVYTRASISDYTFNAIPFGKDQGFGPAMVWPAEFYVAMKLEAIEIERKIENASSLSSPRTKGSNPAEPHLSLDPRSSCFHETTGESDKGESVERDGKSVYGKHRPQLPLHLALDKKTYRYLF